MVVPVLDPHGPLNSDAAATQRFPELPRASQSAPERPRASQSVPELPRASQNGGGGGGGGGGVYLDLAAQTLRKLCNSAGFAIRCLANIYNSEGLAA